jgi:hypothetical protein
LASPHTSILSVADNNHAVLDTKALATVTQSARMSGAAITGHWK